MSKTPSDVPNYRNWVSRKLIFTPIFLGIVTAVFTVYYPWVFIFPPVFLLMVLYFTYARWIFSPKGKNMQVKLQSFILNEIEWDGKGEGLDIGCGQGSLTIRLAKEYPEASFTGVEYRWQVADISERNAELEGVSDRVSFQDVKTITTLPFEDETFDLVVSHLTFHEVMEIRDRRVLLEEALRVLKEGGVFVFQDIFLNGKVFGNIDPFLNKITEWGAEEASFVYSCDFESIPSAIRTPFMVGRMGIIKGHK